ncbi:MAG: OmpA family protein [Myxococcales bacterium]
MVRTHLPSFVSALALALLLSPAAAHAQTVSGFAVQSYDPAYAGDAFFASPDAPVAGRIAPAVKLTFSYANRPLRIVDQATGQTVTGGEVMRDQLYLDLDASLALFDRVKVGIGLPFAAVQTGDASFVGHSIQSTRFADMRIGARVGLLGKARSPLAVGLQADLWLPTGSKEDFAGDGDVRGHPRLVVSGLLYDRWLYSAALGAMLRGQRDVGLTTIGSALTYSAAAGVLLWDKRVQVGPEFFGSTLFNGGTSPVEGMLGAKVCLASVTLGAGVGVGFGTAPGTAAARVLVSAGWEPGRDCRDSGQRLDAPQPLVTEPTAAEKEELARAQQEKEAVALAEKFAAEEAVKKAEAERQAAAALAEQQAAQKEAAEKAQREAAEREAAAAAEEAARVKLAMAQPEPPPAAPVATLKKDSIVINQQVQFELDKAILKPESEKILGAVAQVLASHPELAAIAVEGHTDDSGRAEWNTALSRLRAEAVRDWLIKKGGIAPGRLMADGFGPARPIAPNKDEAGRRMNRRVEFRITSQSP